MSQEVVIMASSRILIWSNSVQVVQKIGVFIDHWTELQGGLPLLFCLNKGIMD